MLSWEIENFPITPIISYVTQDIFVSHCKSYSFCLYNIYQKNTLKMDYCLKDAKYSSFSELYYDVSFFF